MGLDVAFNREQAVAAGIEQTRIRNGSDKDIALAEADEADGMPNQPGYLEWLYTEEPCVRVPGMVHWVEDTGGSNDIVVRANRWGDTYAPLTRWLKANGIEWTEF